MKILLLGEYSNVHWTLAEGLRKLGHEVCVVSDGDRWKGYKRDVDLSRKSFSLVDTMKYMAKVHRLMPKLRNYDVVQIINPIFLDLRASRNLPFYKSLRRHNKRMFMCAFGMDYYWVKTCLDCKTFRYSDFNLGSRQRTEEPFNRQFIKDWMGVEKKPLNEYIAQDCDGIITGLYEYDACYRPVFPDKTHYIPFPIDMTGVNRVAEYHEGDKVRIFIGIQKNKSEYKGTDIMLRAAEKVQRKYADMVELVKVESVPFEEYQDTMNSCHIMLDQLYGYSPAMNALLAMSKGMVVVGGGEEETYDILEEKELRPIINVVPEEEDVYNKLEQLILNPSIIPVLSQQSIDFIRRHHDYVKVAEEYVKVFTSLPTSKK